MIDRPRNRRWPWSTTMRLRSTTERGFKNLEVIRAALEEYQTDETAELINGDGAAHLCWGAIDGCKTHIAIPLAWMDDPDKAEKVRNSTRSFALGVLAASRRR